MLKTLSLLIIFFSLTSFSVQAETDLSQVSVVTSSYKPYNYIEEGKAKGLSVAHARRIFAELDFKPKINVLHWSQAYETALKTPNTLIFSIARTPQREKVFHWIGEIIGFKPYLFRKKENTDLQIKDLFDGIKYRTGALKKDAKGLYLQEHGYTILPISTQNAGVKMVLSGRLDLIPADIHSLKYSLKELGLPDDALVPAFELTDIAKPLYIAFSPNSSPELIKLFKKAYQAAQEK